MPPDRGELIPLEVVLAVPLLISVLAVTVVEVVKSEVVVTDSKPVDTVVVFDCKTVDMVVVLDCETLDMVVVLDCETGDTVVVSDCVVMEVTVTKVHILRTMEKGIQGEQVTSAARCV